MHQNIASALSKMDIMELTLADLKQSKNTPDVICLSETFLKSGHEHCFSLTNYELASFYSRPNKRGGVCILVLKGLNYKKNISIARHAKSNVFECCAVEFPHNNLIIICLYRTPTSDVNIFLNNLDSLLHELNSNRKKKIVVLGDLNINTLKADKVTKDLQDLTKNYNMTIHINEPTRRSSCIDHILSNIDNTSSSVVHLGLSDHETAQMLNFSVENKKQNQKAIYISKRDYSPDNIKIFKTCLKGLSFSEVLLEKDLNKAFDIFHEMIQLFYKLCFPKVKVKIQNNTNRNNWITSGLRLSCRTKRTLRIRYYKSKNNKHKHDYMKYSKLLKKCISQAQKNKNGNFINNSKNKTKAAWQIIKDKDNHDSNKDIDCITINNQKIYDPMLIAEAFNTHFIETSNEPSILSANQSNFKPEMSVNALGCSLYLKPVTNDELRKHILSLNNTKSEGPDEICTDVIKKCIDELTPILTYLVNLSFERGEFPVRLKNSHIKPIHKKGCKNDIANYRPITLIPIISKIFEKCMFDRLMSYCRNFNIINKHQYGFQKQKSTTLAMFALFQEVITSVDLKKLTTVLFLDMSKAFDLVNHSILLRKLEGIGVRGLPLQWFESYLQNRQQCVIITKTNKDNLKTSYNSKYLINKSGVPQGSVLGPLLFIIYINDIVNVTRHRSILFADDISIIVTNNLKDGLTKHEAEINNTLSNIIEWLDKNKLRINLNKTNFIQFNNLRQCNLHISYKNTGINEANSVKFLGINVDKSINWKLHVESVCDKVNRFVYVLKRLRHITDRSTILTAYHAYVTSILRYGLILWGNSVDVHKAFVTQKKCVRAIFGIPPYQTCKPLFKELKLLTLPSLYIFEICKFVKNNLDLFHKARDVYSRNKRNPDRLVLHFSPRTALYMKNCLCMCIKIYNKIPENIKTLGPILFKKKLFAWLLERNFYNVKELIK